MNPTPDAIASIQAHVASMSGGWTSNTDDQISASANSPSVSNPIPQPVIPVPYSYMSLLGVLSSPSVLKLASLSSLGDIMNVFNAGSVADCQQWKSTLAAASVITSSEATAVAAFLAATQPDPAWPAQISWAQNTIGRPLDTSDVSESRPS